jgi:hypothetical protein
MKKFLRIHSPLSLLTSLLAPHLYQKAPEVATSPVHFGFATMQRV